jgi:heme/copper-type cytochrome/quinol oxidase subunit 2
MENIKKIKILLLANAGGTIGIVALLSVLPESAVGWPLLFICVGWLLFLNVVIFRALKRNKASSNNVPQGNRLSGIVLALAMAILALLSVLIARWAYR